MVIFPRTKGGCPSKVLRKNQGRYQSEVSLLGTKITGRGKSNRTKTRGKEAKGSDDGSIKTGKYSRNLVAS